MQARQIGLALSGGGFRATVFHLGVLSRLADGDLLKDVTAISTVSGGSLCAALVYSANEGAWPTAAQFKERVLPRAHGLITGTNLESAVLRRAIPAALFRRFGVFGSRAPDLAMALEEQWGVKGAVGDIPRQPRWIINATCFETAANWRFTSQWMGDYRFGYTKDVALPLSHAVAASCAFPALIGPLELSAAPRAWYCFRERDLERTELASDQTLSEVEQETVRASPPFERIHLYDGGIYDNLGVEALYSPGRGYIRDVQQLLVSDASGAPVPTPFPGWFHVAGRARRLIDVATAQVRGMRARSVVAHFRQKQNAGDVGRFFRIGNSARQIVRDSGCTVTEAALARTQSAEEALLAETMETTIRQLDVGEGRKGEFERLYRNGYEVADYTLFAYDQEGRFQIHGYPGMPT